MTRFFVPRLTAAVTALAIGLSAVSATPAAAMSNNDRNALALLLGIGAIAVIADQNKDRHAGRRDVAPPPRRDHRHDGWRDGHRRADACVVRIERDRHGRRIEVQSPGCRGNHDWAPPSRH